MEFLSEEENLEKQVTQLKLALLSAQVSLNMMSMYMKYNTLVICLFFFFFGSCCNPETCSIVVFFLKILTDCGPLRLLSYIHRTDFFHEDSIFPLCTGSLAGSLISFLLAIALQQSMSGIYF